MDFQKVEAFAEEVLSVRSSTSGRPGLAEPCARAGERNDSE